ncbi:MAG: hypothetical protein ACLTSZ_07270 [Lachnospiraceae bacterium]
MAYAKTNGFNLVFLDTAGRLHVDEDMMQELQQIKEAVSVDQTVTCRRCDDRSGCGECCDHVSEEKIGIDGVILTKLDGDDERRCGAFY